MRHSCRGLQGTGKSPTGLQAWLRNGGHGASTAFADDRDLMPLEPEPSS